MRATLFRLVPVVILLASLLQGWSADQVPAKPQRHFNDYANLVPVPSAQELDRTLEAFEKSDSTQFLVVIYPRRPENTALEDFTIRAAEAWGAGTKKEDNGLILFFFMQDREIRIEVGYGLEGRITDALSKTIIDQEIVPAFRAGQFEQGVRAAVTSLIAASRGEYQGTGTTVRGRERQQKNNIMTFVILGFFLLMFIGSLKGNRRRGGTVYRRSGRSHWGGGPWIGGGWGGGGGGFGGGGGGGGWGGGFSGGGGSFGGGGASGRW